MSGPTVASSVHGTLSGRPQTPTPLGRSVHLAASRPDGSFPSRLAAGWRVCHSNFTATPPGVPNPRRRQTDAQATTEVARPSPVTQDGHPAGTLNPDLRHGHTGSRVRLSPTGFKRSVCPDRVNPSVHASRPPGKPERLVCPGAQRTPGPVPARPARVQGHPANGTSAEPDTAKGPAERNQNAVTITRTRAVRLKEQPTWNTRSPRPASLSTRHSTPATGKTEQRNRTTDHRHTTQFHHPSSAPPPPAQDHDDASAT